MSQQNVQKGSKRLPGPNGVGLNKALHGYAKWFRDIYLPGCKSITRARRAAKLLTYHDIIQHAPNMVIGPIIVLRHATTHTMHLVPCSQIDPSTTPSIGSGSGSFVTSLFSTGKSMLPFEYQLLPFLSGSEFNYFSLTVLRHLAFHLSSLVQ